MTLILNHLPLDQIIAKENASHIQNVGLDDRVLYRTVDGQAQKLSLARVGCGLRNLPGAKFKERDEWFKIGTEQWEPVDSIPTDHALWPAEEV